LFRSIESANHEAGTEGKERCQSILEVLMRKVDHEIRRKNEKATDNPDAFDVLRGDQVGVNSPLNEVANSI
jgi:hypothetical protein